MRDGLYRSPRIEILERLLALAAGPVRERLEKRSDLEFDVPLLISELSELDVCSLLAALAEEFDESTLHDFFCHLLAEDPSRTRPDCARIETLFEEKPFPRYVVALFYLMVMDCREHDFRTLAGPIWNDILAARHLFWPELLTEVLLRVESKEALLEKALPLAASEVEHERFLGENLLYGLPILREELRRRLKEASRSEADSIKARRYKDLFKRYRWI